MRCMQSMYIQIYRMCSHPNTARNKTKKKKFSNHITQIHSYTTHNYPTVLSCDPEPKLTDTNDTITNSQSYNAVETNRVKNHTHSHRNIEYHHRKNSNWIPLYLLHTNVYILKQDHVLFFPFSTKLRTTLCCVITQLFPNQSISVSIRIAYICVCIPTYKAKLIEWME